MTARDLIAYVATQAVLTLAGVSIVATLRVRIDRGVSWLLGACAIQAVWACVLGLTVTAGLPVGRLAPVLWAVTACLACGGAILGARELRAAVRTGAVGDFLADGAVLAVCAALPLLMVAPYLGAGLLEGYRGSGVPDGWSYVALAQFLWEHAEGTARGLSVLHQYGSTFQHQRHVAAAELGMLSWPLRSGDPQIAVGLLQTWAMMSFIASCAAFARLRGHARVFAAALAILVALSGWTANVLWASNYDQALSLAFFPAMMGLVLTRETRTWAGSLLVGLLAAAALHTYPELSPIVLGSVVLTYVLCVLRDRSASPGGFPAFASGSVPRSAIASPGSVPPSPSPPLSLLRAAALAAVTVIVAAALVGIFWPDFVAYLRLQASVRPALATFHGLVEPSFLLSAWWGLGGEHRAAMAVTAQNAAGALLFAVLAAGIVRLLRRGDEALAVVLALLLAGSAVMIFQWHYSYGAYKIILTAWWLVAYALTLVVTMPGTAVATRVLRWTATAIVLAIPGAVLVRDVVAVPSHLPRAMADLRVLEDALPAIGDRPVAILVDNPDACAWAVYFLRSAHARLGDYSNYLAASHIRPWVEQSEPIPWPRVRFVLTDAFDRAAVPSEQIWTLVWRGGAFALWDTGDRPWAMVTDVQQDPPIAPAADRPGAALAPATSVPHVGDGTTRVVILASEARILDLAVQIDRPAIDAGARLAATCGGQTITVPAEALTVPLPAAAGETVCTLTLQQDAGAPLPGSPLPAGSPPPTSPGPATP